MKRKATAKSDIRAEAPAAPPERLIAAGDGPGELPEGIAPEGVAPEILAEAKRSLESERAPKPAPKCIVCGAKATTHSTEHLCWVCLRLKISAWREVEQQAPAQE